MFRCIISFFVITTFLSCNKDNNKKRPDKSKIRSMQYIIYGSSPNDTIFEYYNYDSSGRLNNSILKLNSTGSLLDGYDSFRYFNNIIVEHYKFLNQNKLISYYIHPGINLLDSMHLDDLNTNDKGRMIFYRTGNYLDSMYGTYFFSRGGNTLKSFVKFKYENDELSEICTYSDNEIRLFNFKAKIYYNYLYAYKNGIEDPQNFITSFVFDRFTKNITYSIGRTSDYLLDRYKIIYNFDDSTSNSILNHNITEYSTTQVIDNFSNYRYIYKFSE